MLSYVLSTNVDSMTEAHVQPARLRRLTDVNLLRKLMDRAPGGTLNIRTLAEATGISKSRIGYLLSGEKPVTTAEKADLIAQAVGTHSGAFFSDEQSMSMDMVNLKEANGSERTIDADAHRIAHQLGEDP